MSSANTAAYVEAPQASPLVVRKAPQPASPSPTQLVIRAHSIASNPLDVIIQQTDMIVHSRQRHSWRGRSSRLFRAQGQARRSCPCLCREWLFPAPQHRRTISCGHSSEQGYLLTGQRLATRPMYHRSDAILRRHACS
jgi:hypothetical protein